MRPLRGFRPDAVVLLLVVPVLAIAALSLSSRAQSTNPPPILAKAASSRVALGAFTTAPSTSAPDTAPASNGVIASPPTAEVLGGDGSGTPSGAHSTSSGRSSAKQSAGGPVGAASPSGLADPTPTTTVPAAGPATTTPSSTAIQTPDSGGLPGEQPEAIVSESQSPIFLVLVALAVIAAAGFMWRRSARRRERAESPPWST